MLTTAWLPTPYCGDMVGAEMLFNGVADIDHILPYSRTLDDSPGNKVVAHRACNRSKGNKTPWERWHTDEQRWANITDQVARLHKSKQWRFAPDAMERFETTAVFLARQLTDTQYLSKLARKYLSSLYAEQGEGSGHVYVIPGRMTAMLRRLWGLNSLLPDHNFVENEHSDAPKNRLDHRHHAIDAAVTAVTTRSLVQQLADAAARAEKKDLDRLFEQLPQPWSNFREDLGEKLARVIVSHKPDHGRKGRPAPGHDVTAGRLHNDTAYGLTGEKAADGRTPIVVHRVPLMALRPSDLDDPIRIDQHIEAAVALAYLGEQREHLVFLGEVGVGTGNASPPARARIFSATSCNSSARRPTSTVRAPSATEHLGNAAADAVACAGDDGDLIPQLSRHRFRSRRNGCAATSM